LDKLVVNRFLFWLILSVSALFFGGCIKDEGFAFESPSDLQTARTDYVDTFSVSMETFRMDSLLSNAREYVLAGTYSDPMIGSVSTEGYFQFLPEAYPLVSPDSIILDEYTRATIILNNGTPYGTFGQDQFGLYRLSQVLDGDRSHYSGEQAPQYETQPYLSTLNSTRTDNSIRMDATQLGKDIISFWKEKKSLTDDQQFLERFKGFAIKSLDSVPQVTRFDLQYRNDAAPAFLQVYYRVKRGNEIPEEKVLRFRTDRSSVQYYSILPVYNSPWSAILPNAGLPADDAGGNAVVQEGGGLSVKLNIPGLLSWKSAQNRKVKVFKAELEIKPKEPSSLAPPDFLRISSRQDYQNPVETNLSEAVLNESQVLSLLQQGYPSREAAGQALASRLFAYDAARNSYRCNITGHIQNILDGKTTSTNLNLYGSQWTVSVNRMILNSESVKLRIYYFPF
jgi:hypothetical protein